VALASIAAEPAKTPAGASVPLAQAKPQLVAYLKQQKKQAEIEKLVRDIREKAEVKVNLAPYRFRERLSCGTRPA